MNARLCFCPPLALTILLLAFSASLSNAASPPYGALSVRNGQLSGSNGQAVQLRGFSFWFSQWLNDFWSATVVQALKCYYNANVIRAAMGTDFTGYLDNPTAEQNRVITVVDAAIAQGIYVLIDWHYIGNGNYSNGNAYQAFTNRAVAFFTAMSQRYRAVPNVLYEIWNEPTDTPWETIKTYHNAVIAAIRRNDANAIIICGTPSWSTGPTDTIINSPITGQSNIMYTLHWYPVADSAHLQQQRQMITNARARGMGTFVTEYGTTALEASSPVNAEATRSWWDFLDANQISYINWSMVNREENTAAILPSCSASQVTVDSCLTASGRLVRDKLRSVNSGVSCGSTTTTVRPSSTTTTTRPTSTTTTRPTSTTTTRATTTSASTGGGGGVSGSGVSISFQQVQSWTGGGQYRLVFRNTGTSPICGVTFRMVFPSGLKMESNWNFSWSTGTQYVLPSWMNIGPGGNFSDAGAVFSGGNSLPTLGIVRVTNC